MKKLALIIMLLPAYKSFAQFGMFGSHKDSTSTFAVYKSIGLSGQKFDNLNSRIKSYPQYKALPEEIFTLGVGSIMQKGHFVALNGFTVGYAMNGNRKKKNSTLGFIGINADAGYNVFTNTSRGMIYPTVGLGLEGYRSRFNKDLGSTSFNDVLGSNTEQNSIKPVTFYNLFFNYRFGLNFALQSKDRSGAIGLQLGYTGSFNDNSWSTNYNQVLENSPQDRLSRIFANLNFTKNLNWGHHNAMMGMW